MIRSLWISKTGLDAQQTQLDVISNNLANVSTNGFKRSRPVFQDLLYQTIRQPGAQSSQQTRLPSGMQLGTGVRPVATERMYTQGNLNYTGNAKDLAVNGDGFFQIQMPDGTIGYTRDGAFQTDNQGQIVTASGYYLEPPITVPQNAQTMTVTRDGVVTVKLPDQTDDVQIGQIQLANFINPAGLEARGENLFFETGSSGAPIIAEPGADGMGNVWQNYTETSNVNVVEELVTMIQTQRAYEINSKSITTSDQMLARLSQL